MHHPLSEFLLRLHKERAALIRSQSISWPSSEHPAPEVANEIERLTNLILAYIDCASCGPIHSWPPSNVVTLRLTPMDIATLV